MAEWDVPGYTELKKLGAGGFGLQVPRTGVREVDVVGAVLEESGRRLGDRFQRERTALTNASTKSS